jgi:hypothetical protein
MRWSLAAIAAICGILALTVTGFDSLTIAGVGGIAALLAIAFRPPDRRS